MIFKLIFFNLANEDNNTIEVFIPDQDYFSYLKLFKDDYSAYNRVRIEKCVNNKFVPIRILKMEELNIT